MRSRAWYRTPVGLGTLVYDGTTVLAIGLPRAGARPEAGAPSAPEPIQELGRRLSAYFGGRIARVELPREISLGWGDIGAFRSRVYDVVRSIPTGRTLSYSEVAETAGAPGAARAVGTAMATNPFPVIVPCHRVVRADGSLGGYGGGESLKKLMLELEGYSGEKPARAGAAG